MENILGVEARGAGGEMIEQVLYAWIKIGNTEVYVADIKENEDEMAIIQQITAIEMGWA